MKKRFNEPITIAITAVLMLAVGAGVVALGTGAKPIPQPRQLTTDPADAEQRVEPMHAERLAEADRSAGTNPDQALELVREGRGDLWPCAECHGEDGAGSGLIPRLAGMPAGYLAKQLHDYRAGLRRNATMELVASQLSEDEILELASYFAGQDTPSNTGPRLGGNLERGRTLAYEGDWSVDVPACFTCHGSLAWGVGAVFPPLAAQHPVYTVRQLGAWIDGSRANSPVQLMHAVARGLSRADRQAVADFLATLPPPPAEAPDPPENDDA
jgi:cytochrome c553